MSALGLLSAVLAYHSPGMALGNHECWPGTIHSGPKCTAMLVPLEQLMDTPPHEVADLVAWNPHVRANRALKRIETYDCDGDPCSMASYEALGIAESDLN